MQMPRNMAWVCVNENGSESIFQDKPIRVKAVSDLGAFWSGDKIIVLSEGTIKKILGRELHWEDEPVEL